MEFRISDTFTDSLARLTDREQKAVKTTAFDLQIDPAGPGMQFHKLDRAKDSNFWSLRVNRDIRIIVHRTSGSLMLCYVDHHDDAYCWAERRRIETHPKTGAAQLVEVRERVEEITTFQPVEVAEPLPPKPRLFDGVSDDELLGYGVPADWLDDVRVATEDTLFDLSDHLPQEASEALLDLATGVKPTVPAVAPPAADPFAHPDAQRRFRVLTNVEELERALEFPWEKWTVFLHPAQRTFVEGDYGGPARISGSAGTGKTIVALHRAVYLARCHPEARILLTTFSTTLANALKTKLARLVGNEPEVHARIAVDSITGIAQALYRDQIGKPQIASDDMVKSLLLKATEGADSRFPAQFLFSEWSEVVDAWQLKTWEGYRDVPRLGRKKRIGGKQREILWTIFEQVRSQLEQQNLLTWPDVFARLAWRLEDGVATPFEFAIIDEAQDMGVPAMRFLAALGRAKPDSLFFAGDQGQRIFQAPFSWKALGIDIRGRSNTLRINYRTSHQIRSQADRLLPFSLSDVDGNTESRRGTVSVFNGPAPEIRTFAAQEDETKAVASWISQRLADGTQPHEIGIIVRSDDQLKRAEAAIRAAGVKACSLDQDAMSMSGCVSATTMHLAKGLEFRAVAVMACDDEVLPLQERIESISDESDLEEVYNTERHLLYVACTRARDWLLVSGIDPASEFLSDMSAF